jgi:2-hydroxychromene-2-carboxylate isomerase
VVRFWFDFASTYSYLAAMRLEAQARAWEVPVVWQPFLLGPIFEKQGWNDSPFNLNPARGRYMWRDVQRQAESCALPFRKPSAFPRNSVLAARVACVGLGADWLPVFSLAIFRANFEEDRDIADRQVVAAALHAAGQDPEAVLAAATAPEHKGKLREATDRAWALGIFGAPTFEVAGELFWGNDRLEQAFAWYGRLPVACDLSALQPAERARRADLAGRLRAGATETRTLPDGLAVRVREQVMPLAEVEELMGYERRCCPFLRFAARASGGEVVLEITGGAEAQAFLAAEFG